MATKPKGLPKTGGRRRGTPNKTTADIRALAQEFGEAALRKLVEVMNHADSPPQAKISAANALLDRGYGKPSELVEPEDSTTGMKSIAELDAMYEAAMRNMEAEDARVRERNRKYFPEMAAMTEAGDTS